MSGLQFPSPKDLSKDLLAGLVVFLVALPLCLGVALASNAPMFSGLLAGIIGGLVVGALSGSKTSVSGPAAGLTAVVAAQIEQLGSLEAFLLAVVLAGVFQIVLGVLRAGFLASFFPSSVIKGLLAAIGTILILKQIPHLFGHDPDAMGDMSFRQADGENTVTELLRSVFAIHPGATLVGLASLALLLIWPRIPFLKRSPVPAPLGVVVLGVGLNRLLQALQSPWAIQPEHLVSVPVANTVNEAVGLLSFPDWSQIGNPGIYTAALTIGLVATLETLLNLQAVDNLDPEQRHSPPNRELLAQGAGNMVAGLLGGLPVTSVIVRSSVNIHAGVKTQLSTITHGVLLVSTVLLVPWLLNSIPLACLAAILLTTGFKLASPTLLKQMRAEGKSQLVPFLITVGAIVLTDLLVGIVIGLTAALCFILWGNFKKPLHQEIERHPAGDVLRIQLANQVSFFSRAVLQNALHSVADGGHVLIDGRNTNYIDRDILDLIDDFRTKTAPAHGIKVSLLGLEKHYAPLHDQINFVHHSVPSLQSTLTPMQVVDVLHEGNERFRSGNKLTRDAQEQVRATAHGQSPLAVIFSCVDSRAPAELIFDASIGDLFNVRIAGNVLNESVIGSMEYGCAVAQAKLLVILGHTDCGAVTKAVDLLDSHEDPCTALGSQHMAGLIHAIQEGFEPDLQLPAKGTSARQHVVDDLARNNVMRVMQDIRARSKTLSGLLAGGTIGMVGGVYNVRTGTVDFFTVEGESLEFEPQVRSA